jgi:hypothetical protein
LARGWRADSYTYSFTLDPEWNYYCAPDGEIKAYFEGVARHYWLYEKIRFNTPIEE